MTKFILHGGQANRSLEQIQNLFDEMTSGLPDKARILMVLFSKPESDWSEICKLETPCIHSSKPNAEIALADTNVKQFQEQLAHADAVYVRGGETDLLAKKLEEADPDGNIFRIPVYAGSSAGAQVVSSYYYRRSKGGVIKGFGVLPIKFLAHYGSSESEGYIDWKKVEAEIRAIGEDLPIYKLAEGEQIIIEQGK